MDIKNIEGFRTPLGHFNGLQGKFELLDNIVKAGMSYVSSDLRGKNESLFSICDECGFVGGKRLLKERLLYPSINPAILQKRYDKIECFMVDGFYKEIKTNIHKLNDLEKNLRKMGLDMLDPSSFLTSKLSYDFINRIIDSNYDTKITFTKLYSEYNDSIVLYKNFYKDIIKTFNFKNFYTPEKSLFLIITSE